MRAVLVLSLLLIAGCLDGADPGPAAGTAPSSAGSSAAPLAPTTAAAPAPGTDTGSLVVSVTTSELAPISQAQVVLEGQDLAAFTDDAGAATFNGLSPGTYTVLAAKPGYRSSFEKGRLADVVAGEVAEVKMVLEPESVLAAGEAYHRSFVFSGLIACSTAGAPGSNIGYTSYPCRGVNVAGIEVRPDPNENSTHPWEVESIQVQSVVIEAKWQSSNGVNGKELHMGVAKSFRCTGSGTQAGLCLPDSELLWTVGVSPLAAVRHETANQNLTKFLGKTPDKYPAKVFTAVRSGCTGSSNCPQVNVQLQQKYEAWATAFYGNEAPVGWSVYKTG